MAELSGKSVLVTGGAGRFGQVLTRMLVGEGAVAVIADLGDPDHIQEVAAQLSAGGSEVIGVTADVTVEDDCRSMVEAATGAFGKLDVAVINAGVGGEAALICEASADAWRHTMEVNLTGAFLTAKHAAIAMMPRRYGKIIFVSSRDGLRAEPYTGAYNASKHGLHGLMKTLAIELGPYGINVNAVCPTSMGGMGSDATSNAYWDLMTGKPGATEEEFDAWAGQQNLFARPGRVTPAEVAEGVLWLASDRAGIVTGHALPMDAGWIVKRG